MGSAPGGIVPGKSHRELGITQKSACHMLPRFHKALETGQGPFSVMDRKTLHGFVADRVVMGTRVYADEAGGYRDIHHKKMNVKHLILCPQKIIVYMWRKSDVVEGLSELLSAWSSVRQ